MMAQQLQFLQQQQLQQQHQQQQQQQQHQHQHQQQQQQQPQQQRSRRNRSLDRANEVETFQNTLQMTRNDGLGGSSFGLQRPLGQRFAGSTTHLNLQLGPLQLPPHAHFAGECNIVFHSFVCF
jgi:hypothetical protein